MMHAFHVAQNMWKLLTAVSAARCGLSGRAAVSAPRSTPAVFSAHNVPRISLFMCVTLHSIAIGFCLSCLCIILVPMCVCRLRRSAMAPTSKWCARQIGT